MTADNVKPYGQGGPAAWMEARLEAAARALCVLPPDCGAEAGLALLDSHTRRVKDALERGDLPSEAIDVIAEMFAMAAIRRAVEFTRLRRAEAIARLQRLTLKPGELQ